MNWHIIYLIQSGELFEGFIYSIYKSQYLIWVREAGIYFEHMRKNHPLSMKPSSLKSDGLILQEVNDGLSFLQGLSSSLDCELLQARKFFTLFPKCSDLPGN